jgi:hypothetical protein
MPTCRQRWRAGSRRKGTRRTTLLISGWRPWLIAPSGGAVEMGACIVTKDEDSALLQALDRAGPAVVWIRIGNAVRRVLLGRLPKLWPAVVSAIDRGEKIVEVR